MVAEAALKRDPSAMASDLYRAKQAQRQARAPRGRVLRFPGSPPPAQSNVPAVRPNTALGTADERLEDPDPALMPITSAPANTNAFYNQIDLRKLRDDQEAFIRAKNQQRIKNLSASVLPTAILAAGDEAPQEQRSEALEIARQYQDQAKNIIKQLGESPAAKKQVSKLQQEAVKRIKDLAKKGVRKSVQTVYRAIGDAAPLDVGEVAYIELFVGSMINAYRLFLTVLAVKRRGVKGTFAKYATEYIGSSGAGQLGLQAAPEKKGLLSQLVPGEMDLADPTSYFDILVGLLGWIILLVVIAVIHIILAYIAIFIGAGAVILDAFAPMIGLI